MFVLVTKASNDYWYQFKEVNTIEDILKIDKSVIIEPNSHSVDEITYWDGFKKSDALLLEKAKINIIIYDDYVE